MFKLDEHRTTIRTDVLVGITTFATMMYILVVNPAIIALALGMGLNVKSHLA